jgi:hypothetical protein
VELSKPEQQIWLGRLRSMAQLPACAGVALKAAGRRTTEIPSAVLIFFPICVPPEISTLTPKSKVLHVSLSLDVYIGVNSSTIED